MPDTLKNQSVMGSITEDQIREAARESLELAAIREAIRDNCLPL